MGSEMCIRDRGFCTYESDAHSNYIILVYFFLILAEFYSKIVYLIAVFKIFEYSLTLFQKNVFTLIDPVSTGDRPLDQG